MANRRRTRPGEEGIHTRGHPPDEQREAEPKARTPEPAHPLRRFLIKLLLFALALGAVFIYVLGIHIQHGNRMYPFIMDGDLLITYKLDPYRVGDAVVYRNPQTGELAVSRIVAVGETELEITEEGQLLVDGYIPSESVFYPTRRMEGSQVTFPYNMSREGYFLLDDYREIGMDSRVFGEVPEGAIQGKVVYVFRRRGI